MNFLSRWTTSQVRLNDAQRPCTNHFLISKFKSATKHDPCAKLFISELKRRYPGDQTWEQLLHLAREEEPNLDGSVVMYVIVESAGKAEYGTGFTAAQHAFNARIITNELGHPQPATSILCDHSFAQPRNGLMLITPLKSYRHAFSLATRPRSKKPICHGTSSRQKHRSRHLHQNTVSQRFPTSDPTVGPTPTTTRRRWFPSTICIQT
jgi:hypothetical protein